MAMWKSLCGEQECADTFWLCSVTASSTALASYSPADQVKAPTVRDAYSEPCEMTTKPSGRAAAGQRSAWRLWLTRHHRLDQMREHPRVRCALTYLDPKVHRSAAAASGLLNGGGLRLCAAVWCLDAL